MYEPANQPGLAYVETWSVKDGKRQLLSSHPFRIKRIPDPTVTVDGRRSQKIKKDDFMALKGVLVFMQNFDFDVEFTLDSYKITVIPQGGVPSKEYRITTWEFPQHIRDMISELPENGSQVFIDDLKVFGPASSNPINLGGLAFKFGD